MLCDGIYKHIVPTGLKNGCSTMSYKHIVPTGLRLVLDCVCLLKLTPIGMSEYALGILNWLGNRTYRIWEK